MIDAATLLLMNDEQLTRYIPRHGDRLATIQFCRGITERIQNPLYGKRDKKRKDTLLEKLRKKFRQNDDDKPHRDMPGHHNTSRTGRQKASRMIEVGWLCFDSEIDAYKQVRAKKGGGTRHISVLKSVRKSEIMKIATEMYFPDGISSRGKLSDFTVTLKDFKESDIDNELTLADMYKRSNMRTMRFYLATRKKNVLSLSDSDDDHDMNCTTSVGKSMSYRQATTTTNTTTAPLIAHLAALKETFTSTSTPTAALGAPAAAPSRTSTFMSTQTAALGAPNDDIPVTSTFMRTYNAAFGAPVGATSVTSTFVSTPTAALGAPVGATSVTSTFVSTPTAALGAPVGATSVTSTFVSTPTAALGAPVVATPVTSAFMVICY